jgi:hypothetical protein
MRAWTIFSVGVLILSGCDEGGREEVRRAPCSAPQCAMSCSCDLTFSCDPDCEACDPECGKCRSTAMTCAERPDATPGADAESSDGAMPIGMPDAGLLGCTSQYPQAQTLSAPCCPDWGRDACGALLFCAALDDREQPTCYPERSRQDQTECPGDYACASGSCNLSLGICRSSDRSVCTAEIGCAPTPTGLRTVCDTSRQPAICAEIGGGNPGEICDLGTDCDSEICMNNHCVAGPGGECFQSSQCAPGLECDTCEACADWSQRCVSTCSGLECTDANPAYWSCYERPNLRAPCPSAAPLSTRCQITRRTTDFTSIEVRVNWTGPTADGYQVDCGRDMELMGDRWSIRAPGTAQFHDLVLSSVTRGATYYCRVRLLSRNDSPQFGWLLGPSGPLCSVVAP